MKLCFYFFCTINYHDETMGEVTSVEAMTFWFINCGVINLAIIAVNDCSVYLLTGYILKSWEMNIAGCVIIIIITMITRR